MVDVSDQVSQCELGRAQWICDLVTTLFGEGLKKKN